MKTIQISKKVRVKRADQLNWDVEELKVSPPIFRGKPNPKAGEERWVTTAHYPTLGQALTGAGGVLERLYKGGNEQVTLEQAVEIILQAKEAILEALERAMR